MNSRRSGLVGAQQPRVCLTPGGVVSSAAGEAFELALMAGLRLDPWQRFVLEHALAERADGRWAAFEVGLVVGRQNGKGAILEARELAGLFLDVGDELIIHTAHQFNTSLEAFMRMEALLDSSEDLSRRVKSVDRSKGSEGFRMRNGKRLRYQARTGSSGRGFTADLIILDEAMDLPEATMAALMPTLSSVPNPQIWYTGSAVDQLTQLHGTTFSRVRAQGHAGENDRMAYFEWGMECENPDLLTLADLQQPENWAVANPALGIRISEEYIQNELRSSMGLRAFAVERLGVGDWPPIHAGLSSVIGLDVWNSLIEGRSRPSGAVCFALDVTPDRSWSSISAVGERDDGLAHIELVDRRRGTGWVPERVVELMTKNQNIGTLVLDGRGPAASLVDEIQERGVEVLAASAADQASACGLFYDAVTEKTARHLGQPELEAAVRGGTSRPLGDAWAWSRKSSSVDISPLVSATLALWGLSHAAKPPQVLVSSVSL